MEEVSKVVDNAYNMYTANHTVLSWVVVNALLWLHYAYVKPNSSDFGEIKERSVRKYLLAWASFAYIMNFVDIYT